jgi:hypothetical protein
MTQQTDGMVQGYDPTGHARVIPVTPAARPASLEGLRPGLLVNRKMNARLLMESMMTALGERVPLQPVAFESKPSNGPASTRVLERLKQDCDFALVGTSD